MSSAPLPHQRISDTSATGGSIALAGHFPNLTKVTIGARESSPVPKPFSTVPFRRDPDFVDRGDLLSRVEKRCSQPAGHAALVGLGGVGKSQIAIEYTYRTQKRSPDTWIFWVHAGNAARFVEDYQDIADVVKIAGRDDPKANILKMVHDWLRGYEGTWLIVLDNVDNADFLVNAQGPIQCQSSDSSRPTLRPLRDYLPQSRNGSILITTRSRESALQLSELSNVILVDPMDPSDAVKLLEKKLESTIQGNHDKYIELAAALEFMPLAIVQAAAYISQGEPRCSVQQYLAKFRRNDSSKTSLLDYKGGQLRRDADAKNSIIITWQISFDHIHQSRSFAADLLSLMSFFDRQGIPKSLIRDRAQARKGHEILQQRCSHDIEGNGNENGSGNDRDSISESDIDEEFENDVRVLRDFSLVSFDAKDTFAMHALVQLATRKWLEAHGKLEQWKQCFIKNLSAKFPSGELENWTHCQALFPHAKSAVTQRPKAEESLKEWASLVYRAAWYIRKKGNLAEAIALSEIAMKARIELYGEEHELTLTSKSMMGLTYNLGGRWNEAEELILQVIEIEKRILGQEHPSTLNSMANLAFTFWKQGRWQEAEELEVQLIKIAKRVLGLQHPDTITQIGNLSSIYRSQGRWKEAGENQIQVIDAMKKALGQEHPDTLTSIANLALVFRVQGRSKEAEILNLQVLEIRERILGYEHPDTLTSKANLALTFWGQGRWKEAEELQISVIEISKRVRGQEHPDTLTTLAGLAWTLWNQGRWKEAEELQIKVMETTRTIQGQEHPDTLDSMANFAIMLKHRNRYKEAISLLTDCFELRKRILGSKHPWTKITLQNLSEWKSVDERKPS